MMMMVMMMMKSVCVWITTVDLVSRRHVTRDLEGEVLMIAQVMSREGDNYRGHVLRKRLRGTNPTYPGRRTVHVAHRD